MKKDKILKFLKNTSVRKGLLMLLSIIIFYLIFPKYEFHANGFIRANKITGKVERVDL